MSIQTKTLAKSLHTVSVLANLAAYMRDSAPLSATATSADWVERAAAVLGYADAVDTYGLKAKAAKSIA